MSQRVTLDNSGLRSRLRATPAMHRGSSYQTRKGNRPAVTSVAGKPVINDITAKKHAGSPVVALQPRQASIEKLIVFPAAQEELENVANAVARQRAEVLAKMSASRTHLQRASDHVRPSRQGRGIRDNAFQPSRAVQHVHEPMNNPAANRAPVISTVAATVKPAAAKPQPSSAATVHGEAHDEPAPTYVRRSAVWQPALPVQPQMNERRSRRAAKKHHVHVKFKLTQTRVLMAMAVIVFVVGIGVSVMGMHANRQATAQALAVSKQVDKKAATATAGQTADAAAPSTTPVSSTAVKSYVVAPDLARYITIPSIGVHARVLQVGVTSDGALGTPANVFDTAWYTGSAKPGQAGATLIDGHVSSWTSHGVFYNIKNLKAGDTIQIEKGDGQMLNYSVVKTVAFDANNVDMQSLMVSADSSKSGLNLITCGGKYDSSSKEFTQRIAVYAVLQ